MIIVIAGDDIVSSRKKMTELLENKPNVIRLNGREATIAELEGALSSIGLFSNNKTVVVEYFTELTPGAKVFELLKKIPRTTVGSSYTDIILWDETDISAKIKTTLKSAKIFTFQFPRFYYQFLDTLEAGSKKTLNLLHEVLKTYESEQILYGLARRVRQLLIMKSSRYSEFLEFKKLQVWQIKKLKEQAEKWQEMKLMSLLIRIAELDEELKTSNVPLPLTKRLDIMLLSDLN